VRRCLVVVSCLEKAGVLQRMLKEEDKECRIIAGGYGKPARGIWRGLDGMLERIFAAAFGQTKSMEGRQGTGAFSSAVGMEMDVFADDRR